MTEDQAMRVLSPLVAFTGTWDDPKVEMWVHKLSALEHPDWASEAIDQVIDTHTSPGIPPWAKVLEAYQAISRRHGNSRHALPSAEHCMKLPDYLTNLKLHAAGGNTGAQIELERWERLASKPRHGDATPNWAEALR